MRRLLITETNSVHVVLVTRNAKYGLPSLDVVYVYGVVASTCYDLSSVAGEAN